MGRDVVRGEDFSERVYTDPLVIIVAVAVTKQPLILCLLLLMLLQNVRYLRNEGKGTAGRIVLQHIVKLNFAIDIDRLLTDPHLFLFKIDILPS